MKPLIYLDHVSATPLLPEAREAMLPFFDREFGNPSSLHQLGIHAQDAMESARESFQELMGAEHPEEILFTSGGTESLNLAIKGAAFASESRGRHLVTSQIEHPAILQSFRFLEERGFEVTLVPVDRMGRVDPEEVGHALRADTILAVFHQANHEIGAIQPLKELSAVCAARGVPLAIDATCSGGWIPLDVRSLEASFVALAPQRFYGPRGAGVLYKSRRARMVSLHHGGVQEDEKRAGGENVPAIVGAGVAARAARDSGASWLEQAGKLQDRCWKKLSSAIEHIQLNGPPVGPHRFASNLNFSSEFTEGEGQALLCDMQGFAVASGSSCLGKALHVSHVLTGIGIDEELARSAIIVSLGKDNTGAEIDAFAETFPRIIGKLRAMSPAWEDFQKGLAVSKIT